jgi:transcriptional regulator GlxA family with amidase domain
VGGIAAAMRVSPRALRRRFASAAGVAPKRWLRLSRLDGVLRDPALADPRQSLARLAAEHGYADQAHLAREVARFTGATPSALRTRAAGLPPHLLPKS